MTAQSVVAASPLTEDEQARADVYGLLQSLLKEAPSAELLSGVQRLMGDESAFGQAIDGLAEAARQTTVEAEAEAYQELFIGLGRGKLVPFASFYLTGFLHEKPLAELRGDLRELGVEKAENVSEPEDHVAAIAGTMALLIADADVSVSLCKQRAFFDKHIASWADVFFGDLAKSRTSAYFERVGEVGKAFIDVEKAAFEMLAE